MTKSLLDKSFVYVPSVSTDIRKTFERIRRQQRKDKADEAQRAVAPAPLPFESVTFALLKTAKAPK